MSSPYTLRHYPEHPLILNHIGRSGWHFKDGKDLFIPKKFDHRNWQAKWMYRVIAFDPILLSFQSLIGFDNADASEPLYWKFLRMWFALQRWNEQGYRPCITGINATVVIKEKGKMNKRLIAGVIAAAAGGFLLWQYLTPVEIVAVHKDDTILVRHFPYLKSRQIAWWESNEEMIQAKYGIPHKYSDGRYGVVIMDFGEGYRTDRGTDQDSNLLCFDEMSVDARCIEKNPRLWIDWSSNTKLRYR